jgi:hypothetical protein
MRFPSPQNVREANQIISYLHQLRNKLELLIKPVYNGEVTLTENVTTTTVSDGGVFRGDRVFLQPTTANAAAAVPTTFISSVTNGQFVITHANAATTDRTFYYLVTTRNEFV